MLEFASQARAAAASNGAAADGGRSDEDANATNGNNAEASGGAPTADTPSEAAAVQSKKQGKRIKWKALSTAVLQAKGGTMKVRGSWRVGETINHDAAFCR